MLTQADVLSAELEALLARSMFPDPEHIRRMLETYQTDPTRCVFTWGVEGRPVSAAGIRQHDGEVEVLHLGTAPPLLHTLAAHLSAARMVAETDDGAAEFYRRAGFEVRPIPSRWERARYRCVLISP
ncbi:hypothetical protein [Deinococcus planocerae]|uniref:hypothetical protein n=1 Tax=Deinococcus planocerae TaxID=1737569 RepID=UPI000C7F2D38|nr:hypothetical protein [Deinococcus planocerae]